MADVTVHPRRTHAYLHNPGMGVLYLLRGVNKPRFEDVPPDSWFLREGIADKVLVDVPWSVLEPREGDYQWEHREWEGCFNTWIRAGFKVSLQVRGMGSLGTLYDDGTPQWVFDAGAACIDESPEHYRSFGTRRPVDDRPLRAPVYWDPVYIEKAANLVAALGKRYNDCPSVEFVMTGHLGKWGEMHVSLGIAPLALWLAAGLTPTRYLAAARQLADVYRAAFPHTQLVQELGGIAFGEQPDGVPLDFYAAREFVPHLVERRIALKQNGYREGWARHENLAARCFEACYPKVPVMHESWGMFGTLEDMKALRGLHGSYWNRGGEAQGLAELHILGEALPVPRGGAHTESVHELMARTTVEERQEIWRAAARTVGFRFTPTTVSFPARVTPGRLFRTRVQWTNHGAAPCYHHYHVALSLVDGEGRVAWEGAQMPEIPTSSLLWDAGRTLADTLRWVLPAGAVRPGSYRLCLGMRAPDRPEVRIGLPIEGDVGGRRYAVGTIQVE